MRLGERLILPLHSQSHTRATTSALRHTTCTGARSKLCDMPLRRSAHVVAAVVAAQAPQAPSPMAMALGAPPPPPPRLVAGLRGLLRDIPRCSAACMERAEDWFEQAERWGATSVESMVRLALADNFVNALALPPESAAEVTARLRTVQTTITPVHDEV